MRTDCWQFDQIAINKVEDYSPYSWSVTSQYPDLWMDYAMEWEYICSAPNMDNVFCADNEVTIRSLWDMTRWGVSYELGSFWTDNQKLQKQCSGNLNASWFYFVDEAQQKRFEAMAYVQNEDTMHLSMERVGWFALFVFLPICIWTHSGHRRRSRKVGIEEAKYGAVTQDREGLRV